MLEIRIRNRILFDPHHFEDPAPVQLYKSGTVPTKLTRVADPVHFQPDPDPANQNFPDPTGT